MGLRLIQNTIIQNNLTALAKYINTFLELDKVNVSWRYIDTHQKTRKA